MNCEDFRNRLNEAANGPVDGPLQSHLHGCADCRAELKRYQDLWALLLASSDVQASGRFLPGLRAKLPGSRSRILRYVAPFAAASAALLIMFSAVLRPPAPPTASSYIEEELSRMSPEDRALFQALDDNNTWDLAEQYEVIHSMDAVSGEWPPAEDQK